MNFLPSLTQLTLSPKPHCGRREKGYRGQLKQLFDEFNFPKIESDIDSEGFSYSGNLINLQKYKSAQDAPRLAGFRFVHLDNGR